MAMTTEKRVSENEKRVRPKKSGRARAWELDALRGLSILMVVWDHFMYSVGHIFYLDGWEYSDSSFLNAFGEFALDYWHSTLRLYGWPVFVFIFFFVSGICTAFSRHKACGSRPCGQRNNISHRQSHRLFGSFYIIRRSSLSRFLYPFIFLSVPFNLFIK